MSLTTVLEKGVYCRWTKGERVQHMLLATSFTLLAITGFALQYPDAWWVKPFQSIAWLFDLRGFLHRVAATVFGALGIYHIYFIFINKRGIALRRALTPNKQDWYDLGRNLMHNFGLSRKGPRFGHFSYIEKVEYLALIWGSLIMGVTGFMLWFEGITLSVFSRWVIDLVTVIHLYEAWLATLAIIVWHFYFVIFSPEVYPLYTSMFDGKINDEQLRELYPAEWEALQEGMNSPQDSKAEAEKEAM